MRSLRKEDKFDNKFEIGDYVYVKKYLGPRRYGIIVEKYSWKVIDTYHYPDQITGYYIIFYQNTSTREEADEYRIRKAR